MPEENVSRDAILQDFPRLGPDDLLEFQCGSHLDCFTQCCRDVSIVLTPYDVLRMKNALHMDSGEFLQRHTIVSFTRRQKLPIVLLKMDPDNKDCGFITKSGCGIYADRPWACRMYPLGMAEPQNPNSSDHKFYFVLHENLCHGHQPGKGSTVREWIEGQGVELYEMMGASFKQLMLNEFWEKGEPLPPDKVEMYLMGCYDLDRFRRFVFETRFLELFDVEETRIEAIAMDDLELLDFAMQWLGYCLFNEKTMRLKKSVLEARREAIPGSEFVTMHSR
jgi:hypothetical protein